MNWAGRIKDSSTKKPETNKVSVAVIGAGISGLTAAYKLSKLGFKVTVFEASDHIGGRVQTKRNAFSPQHQFCELGGEWIDSNHKNIMALARELGLDIQDVSPKRKGDDLNFIDGAFYKPSDFINREGTGAYVSLAHYIGRDRKKASQNIDYAKKLDAQSIDEYLIKAAKETKTPAWVTDSIRAAYKGQYGIEPNQMSALQLINHIGTGLKMPFSVYGYKQDESRRIKGGNSRLIEKLHDALKADGIEIKKGWSLDGLGYSSKVNPPSVYTEFIHNGRKKTHHFDYVVLSVPFSKLKEVRGINKLQEKGLISAEKQDAIQNLGYGNIVKVMLGLKGRPWEKSKKLHCQSNGSFRSDNPYLQNCWITSYGQRGNEEENILTVLVAGNEASSHIAKLEEKIKEAYASMLGLKVDDIFNHRHAEHNWSKDNFSRGSYSYFKPGQYTRFRTITGTPEINGKLGFVGEHTDPELYGYMEGAVQSALREVERIKAHATARIAAYSAEKKSAAR